MSSQNFIIPNVRQNIFDGMRLENVLWSGELDCLNFLKRLFDLNKMPSTDSRFDDAEGDVWQHCINNYDWEDDWIFFDERFNLLHCSDTIFLKFICETIHPVVRPDSNVSKKLATHYNDQLHKTGWNLVETDKIAGRVVYKAERINDQISRNLKRANTAADILNADWMRSEIQRIENTIESDPAAAIGTAKELVESCCKTILDHKKIEYTKKDDLPKLTKLVTKELQLVPDGISNKAKGVKTIRRILNNLSALTQYLAELRGLYGSGHGRSGKYRGLQPRHAKLAVGAAVAFIDFIADTYHDRETKS